MSTSATWFGIFLFLYNSLIYDRLVILHSESAEWLFSCKGTRKLFLLIGRRNGSLTKILVDLVNHTWVVKKVIAITLSALSH